MTSFPSSRLKIRRAQRHIEDLDNVISGYAARQPARCVAEQSQPGRHDWTIRVSEDAPEEIPAILGDVIHNLRTALDLMATDIVRLAEGNANNVYFPFAENKDELAGQVKKKNFHRAPAEALALLNKIAPYKGGNYALRAIHDLDIMDKHKMLVPVYAAAVLPPIQIGTNLFNQISTNMEEGLVALSVPAAPNVALGYSFPVTPSAQFHWDGPFATQEIVPVLHHLVKLVSGVIDAFDSLGTQAAKVDPD